MQRQTYPQINNNIVNEAKQETKINNRRNKYLTPNIDDCSMLSTHSFARHCFFFYDFRKSWNMHLVFAEQNNISSLHCEPQQRKMKNIQITRELDFRRLFIEASAASRNKCEQFHKFLLFRFKWKLILDFNLEHL